MDKDLLDGVTMFLAVAEHKSFTVAGARLKVSATAVSKSIRVLEQRHGVSLFQRTTGHVALTEAGDALYKRLRPAVEDIDGAFEALNGFRDNASGTLRVTMTRSACTLLIGPMVERFRLTHPDVHLDLTLDEAAVDLVESGFDAGIRLGEALAKDMVALRLTPDITWSIVGSPAYFARAGRPQTPHDLVDHEGLLYRFGGSGALHRWDFQVDDRKVIVDIPSKLTVNDRSTLGDFARKGLGLAYMGDFEVSRELASGELEQVLLPFTPPSDGLYLYFPVRTQSQAKLRAFIDALRPAV
ncbi:LysR family transcriptional regulator [Burkholderia sp. PAMC 26561]|uniref:LysR family transcriptional regulator n=1 Tax=Burkholderia sp. PAMC 26561 TaxID=1795043 RepID=UPI00076B2679|nr:LysR family transcriptional regulator [Burkholderia sp. PAMC 26561]AMH44098.1 transcriptional regulator [Burkholderia sp. PAMC 26561]